MVNGIYTASAGMINMLDKTEVVSHNLANTNTAGFKKSVLLAESQVLVRRNDEWKLHQDENSKLNGNYVNWEKGPLVSTGEKFDLALQGEGFFRIQTPAGERYTRNGSFTRNSGGELVTLNGNQVLDQQGRPIKVGTQDFKVAEDGTVFADGKASAKIGVMQFNDRTGLSRVNGSLFAATPPSTPVQATNAGVRQGFLEGSNVSVVDAMVEMIRYNRNYEADSKAMQSCDSTLEKAVNEIGRVNG